MALLSTSAGSPAFTKQDFAVFSIPGLEPRMEALIARVRPKLQQLGDRLAPELSVLTGEEMFAHVAKHARRTVHPPADTWVAWAANKRGYKMLPHFQVGLFENAWFAQFAIIYESNYKSTFAASLTDKLEQVQRLVPGHFRWSMDHTKPESSPHAEMSDSDFHEMAHKLVTIKKSEAMVGIWLQPGDVLLSDGEALVETVLSTFQTLLPLYRMSFETTR